MKTIADLNSLLPTLIKLIKTVPHNVCDSDSEGESNFLYYDKDGWDIQIRYECYGEWDNDPGDYWTAPSSELVRVNAEVTELFAHHYDEKTGEEIDFSEEELREFWIALDKAIETI